MVTYPAEVGSRRAAVITLGCARNEVDSEELAARLLAGGWELATDPADSDVVLVNTCGFIDAAKQESIETLLDAAAVGGPKVVAAGCLAQRYGRDLAAALPEAAVLSFADYPEIAARLDDVVAGRPRPAHAPEDRRRLLPIAPVARRSADLNVPGHSAISHGQTPVWNGVRHRLDGSVVAPLKIASGCDRRCAFCAIPSFRGSFVSRPVAELVSEAQWLVSQGVRELVLVSENSTSYGKDLGAPDELARLLGLLSAIPELARIRTSYLQPAELRPAVIAAILETEKVAPYFDLSFQHASPTVLRRMRRFGGTDDFLGLLERIRAQAPSAGFRSNFIVGFPGETEDEFAELLDFVAGARLDAIGVFEYSDEEGTEGALLPDKVPVEVARERGFELGVLAESAIAERAAARSGTRAQVLVEAVVEGCARGRTEFQGPEDLTTVVRGTGTAQVGRLLPVWMVDAQDDELELAAVEDVDAER